MIKQTGKRGERGKRHKAESCRSGGGLDLEAEPRQTEGWSGKQEKQLEVQ